jgi:hypothetical protein
MLLLFNEEFQTEAIVGLGVRVVGGVALHAALDAEAHLAHLRSSAVLAALAGYLGVGKVGARTEAEAAEAGEARLLQNVFLHEQLVLEAGHLVVCGRRSHLCCMSVSSSPGCVV